MLTALNIRSIHSISVSVNLTPFRAPKPAILHLILLGLSPENVEKISKVFINSITGFSSLRKNVVWSAYAVYRNILSKILRPLIFSFWIINKNAISKTSVNQYAEIGSPCLVPLSSLK